MSSVNPTATSNNSSDLEAGHSETSSGSGTVYPPQLHAGKVGYGPHYHVGPTIGERMKGYEEELKGHLTHNHALTEHGRMLVSGELKRQERDHDLERLSMQKDNPFKQDAEGAESGESKGRPNESHEHKKGEHTK
ncbi:hypothetical protein H0H93_007762 [Arthromyces matolae]|nr:hypothetical protein H0H93_007762 [Arthromyces matolae]